MILILLVRERNLSVMVISIDFAFMVGQETLGGSAVSDICTDG
jgi:hypothetical protein